MKGLVPLLLGIFGTFAFSWVGLIMIPNAQIGHLDPQIEEDGTDAYPAPRSGMAERGRKVYVSSGCQYCHSQQVRPDYAAADIERKWGERRSAPRDYIFDRPILLGKMRTGPDLANIGKRAPAVDANAPAPDATNASATAPAAARGATPASAPAAPSGSPPPGTATAATSPTSGAAAAPAGPASSSPAPNTGAQTADASNPPTTTVGPTGLPLQYSAEWHHRHLYDPRSIVPESNMPSFAFLYEKRRIAGEPAADAVKLSGPKGEPGEDEIVPSCDAKCLVAYLMSLDQSHALKEVKSNSPASPPAPGKAAAK